MAKPRIVDEPPLTLNTMPETVPAPLMVIIGVPPKPGCVVASIVTGSVIAGRSAVRVNVCGPDPMAKEIVSAPELAFAARVAALRDPATLSAVVVTVKVINGSEGTTTGATNPSRSTTRSESASLLTREFTTAVAPPSSSTDADTTSGH